jgi:hypothetical protein
MGGSVKYTIVFKLYTHESVREAVLSLSVPVLEHVLPVCEHCGGKHHSIHHDMLMAKDANDPRHRE